MTVFITILNCGVTVLAGHVEKGVVRFSSLQVKLCDGSEIVDMVAK